VKPWTLEVGHGFPNFPPVFVGADLFKVWLKRARFWDIEVFQQYLLVADEVNDIMNKIAKKMANMEIIARIDQSSMRSAFFKYLASFRGALRYFTGLFVKFVVSSGVICTFSGNF